METILGLFLKAILPVLTSLAGFVVWKVNQLINNRSSFDKLKFTQILLDQISEACTIAVNVVEQSLNLKTERKSTSGKLSTPLQEKARDLAFITVEKLLGDKVFEIQKILKLDYAGIHHLIISYIESAVVNRKDWKNV